MQRNEIETQEAFEDLLKSGKKIKRFTFQGIDLKPFDLQLKTRKFKNCIFLGCQIPEQFLGIILKDNAVFPELKMPYDTYRNTLYDAQSLFGGYELGNPSSYNKTLDAKVYQHFIKTGKFAKNIRETLARRLHDHSITDSLMDFLSHYSEKQCVAFMGGHSLSRTSASYKKVVEISKTLTEKGYLMISGGGPGAMEATHLGACLAGKSNRFIEKAFSVLERAPKYKDLLWLDTAMEVLEMIGEIKYKSLGIPTWLYGHEMPTPFASHIAKYFANSVREDNLLTVAYGGIIFAPGSAGTIQEVFQEATQNHYLSLGYASPMVFMDINYWTKEVPIYPMLYQMQKEGKYKNLLLSIYNNTEKIVAEIEQFEPNTPTKMPI